MQVQCEHGRHLSFRVRWKLNTNARRQTNKSVTFALGWIHQEGVDGSARVFLEACVLPGHLRQPALLANSQAAPPPQRDTRRAHRLHTVNIGLRLENNLLTVSNSDSAAGLHHRHPQFFFLRTLEASVFTSHLGSSLHFAVLYYWIFPSVPCPVVSAQLVFFHR